MQLHKPQGLLAIRKQSEYRYYTDYHRLPASL